MIRLRIKPNFADLGRKYWFDYKNAKIRYSEEKVVKIYKLTLPKPAKNIDIYNNHIIS